MNYEALDEALTYLNEGIFNRFKKKKKEEANNIDSDTRSKIEKICITFASELQSKYGAKLKKISDEDTFDKVEVDYKPSYRYFDVDFSEISQDSYFELGDKFWKTTAKSLSSKLNKVIKIEDYKVADDIALLSFKYNIESVSEASVNEAISINYNKIEYEQEDKELFDRCVAKFKKRLSSIANDIADQLYDMIDSDVDDDDPDKKQYNSVSKIKSKLKVDNLIKFNRYSRDPYEGEFEIYLNIGSNILGDHFVIAYVNICQDGKENIFHKDYDVDVELEG